MPDVVITPEPPATDPRPAKLGARSPTFAFGLSFLWPGLGQLYCGQPGLALLFALTTHLLPGFLLFGWALFEYSSKIYWPGVLVVSVVTRFLAAPAAFMAAHRASQERRMFQTPGAYGFFLVGSLLAGQLLEKGVRNWSAELATVSEDREGFLAGDEILLRKGADARAPRVGKVVVFNRALPAQIGPDGKAMPAMRERGMGRVTEVSGETFAVDGSPERIKLDDYLGEARAVFLSRGKDHRLRWDRIGLRPGE